MNDIPQWVRMANPAAWALLNIIGQTTTLPLSLGGLNVSTGQAGGVLAFTSTNTVSSTAGGTSTQVLHGHATLPFYGSVSLTADVSGILPIVNGGTNASTLAGVSTSLGLSTMAFQSHSTVAITGGSISSLAYLSTSAISTGTLRALTNVSSATVSSASVYAATQVSTSSFALAITSLVANLNADRLDSQDGAYYTHVSNQVLSAKTLSVADSPYTVLASDYYLRVTCSSGDVTVLFPHASTKVRTLYVKKIDSTISTVTISSIATDTFDGAVTTALASQYATKGFISPVTGLWERLTTPTI